ncbi:Hypothetical protein HVR_LOCUS278 [uncultured virus]|nr:Hypothetical protein HVR_LOCUS278 [uncultured virus]
MMIIIYYRITHPEPGGGDPDTAMGPSGSLSIGLPIGIPGIPRGGQYIVSKLPLTTVVVICL